MREGPCAFPAGRTVQPAQASAVEGPLSGLVAALPQDTDAALGGWLAYWSRAVSEAQVALEADAFLSCHLSRLGHGPCTQQELL